ncbi:MAG: superoxide dismutase [Alistipes sp.]|nr:superoxide dismutase [Alistipes sp.]
MVHQLPKLPYAEDALAPQMSRETLEYHYGKHHQAYVNNLNHLIADTAYADMSLEEIVMKADGAIFNNAAQAWNHTFFFYSLSPSPKSMPSGTLAAAIDRDFGSFDGLKEQFSKAAAGLFGSGWVWLVKDDPSKLSILAESNAGNPLRRWLTPLLCIDVWEHAYYIDYRNRRPDFIQNFWDFVDWSVVEERFVK